MQIRWRKPEYPCPTAGGEIRNFHPVRCLLSNWASKFRDSKSKIWIRHCEGGYASPDDRKGLKNLWFQSRDSSPRPATSPRPTKSSGRATSILAGAVCQPPSDQVFRAGDEHSGGDGSFRMTNYIATKFLLHDIMRKNLCPHVKNDSQLPRISYLNTIFWTFV